jgi:hypothetical protein
MTAEQYVVRWAGADAEKICDSGTNDAHMKKRN